MDRGQIKSTKTAETRTVDLSADLAQKFGADPETVLKDVLDVTRQFGAAGFLEGVAESTQSGPQGEFLAVGGALPPMFFPG